VFIFVFVDSLLKENGEKELAMIVCVCLDGFGLKRKRGLVEKVTYFILLHVMRFIDEWCYFTKLTSQKHHAGVVPCSWWRIHEGPKGGLGWTINTVIMEVENGENDELEQHGWRPPSHWTTRESILVFFWTYSEFWGTMESIIDLLEPISRYHVGRWESILLQPGFGSLIQKSFHISFIVNLVIFIYYLLNPFFIYCINQIIYKLL